jgi:hypothetical protein
MAGSRRTRPVAVPPFLRDVTLFFGGVIGVFYETIFTQADRPYLLVVFAAMMGLPTFFASSNKSGIEKKIMQRFGGYEDEIEDPPPPKPKPKHRVQDRPPAYEMEDLELDEEDEWYRSPEQRHQHRRDDDDPRETRRL